MQVVNGTNEDVDYSVPGVVTCARLLAFKFVNMTISGQPVTFYEKDKECVRGAELATSPSVTPDHSVLLTFDDSGQHVAVLLEKQ